MRTHLLGMKTSYTKAYFMALALVLLVSFAMNAEAKWTRTQASACSAIGSGGTPALVSWSLFNVSPTQDTIAVCPISDTDYFLKQNVTTLNVHGFNANTVTPTLAQACITYWNTFSGSCGAPASTSSYGHYALQPSLTAWNSANVANFGFLYVRIPRTSSAGIVSSLRGYYTAGN